MIKIFEMQQQLNSMLSDIDNYQSKVIECDSFKEYTQNVEVAFGEDIQLINKYVDCRQRSIVFLFRCKIDGKWIEFSRFGQVLN